MSGKNHLIQQEELMAYLDGELATDRAVAAAAHLERCQECQELAAELRKMSQEMMAWKIEESGITELPDEVTEALEKGRKEPKKQKPGKQVISLPVWIGFFFRRWKLISGLAVVGLFAALVAVPNLLKSPQSVEFSGPSAALRKPSPSEPSPAAGDAFTSRAGT